MPLPICTEKFLGLAISQKVISSTKIYQIAWQTMLVGLIVLPILLQIFFFYNQSRQRRESGRASASWHPGNLVPLPYLLWQYSVSLHFSNNVWRCALFDSSSQKLTYKNLLHKHRYSRHYVTIQAVMFITPPLHLFCIHLNHIYTCHSHYRVAWAKCCWQNRAFS